jgi:hypothetical protein
MPHGFLTTLGRTIICHYAYANNAHLTPLISFKFILLVGFDQCYMSLGRMLIKPHMCHFTYATHVYVSKTCVNQACFIKFYLRFMSFKPSLFHSKA